MDWATIATTVGSITAVLALQTTFLLWMMSKLDNDIKGVSTDLKAVAADSNAKWMAANTRVDQTQAIIMRMLEKQGK